MAINGVSFNGSEVLLGIAQEAALGTAIADNAAFVKIPEFDSIDIDFGVTQDTAVKHTGLYYPVDSDLFTSQTGGARVITINNQIVRRQELAELAYAVCQNVTEGASTPFQKTFAQLTPSNKPNFASNGGYFATIGIDHLIAGYDMKFKSSICRELRLSADLVGGDGRLRATSTWISGFIAGTTSTYSGTWTAVTNNYFDFNSPSTKQVAGADIVLYSFDMTFANNAKRIGNNSTGEAQAYSLAVPEFSFTGTIVCKYDANVQGFLADYLAGTPRRIQIAVGGDGVAGYLNLDSYETVFTNVRFDHGRAEGAAVSIDFKAIYDSGANNVPMITVADALDQTW